MAIGGIIIPRVRRSARALAVDRRLLVYVAAFACIPLSFIVYWPRVNDFFVFDDYFDLATVRNHSFPSGMVRAFEFTTPKPFDPAIPFWRPLIDVYFYAAKPVGLHSQPYHIVNFTLHGLVGALAVVLLFRLTRSILPAVAAGLLFVVAPTYDFAVSWIGQVSELLGYSFMLTALLAHHEYLTAERRRRSLAIATFGCAFFALLTKESTVILALLLPALTFAVPPGGLRRTRSQIGWSLGPPVLMIGAFAIAMEVANHLLGLAGDHSVGVHIARNWWRFLEWIVLPYRRGELMATREALAALFVFAGLASVALRQRLLSFLFIWTVVAIVPYATFDHPIELRYAYLATLPFTAFVVVGLDVIVRRLPLAVTVPGYALLGCALVLALIVTPLRTRDEQAGFAFQSRQYERMVNSVRNLCGVAPAGDRVYVVGSGIIDVYGLNVPAALNVYYDHVDGAAVPELPPLAAFIPNKCVIEYDWQAQRFFRTE